MSDLKSKAEKLLSRQTASLRKAADDGVFNESWFGRYVVEALSSGRRISRSDLRTWLEDELIRLCPSDTDPMRPFLEAAIRRVDESPPESSEST